MGVGKNLSACYDCYWVNVSTCLLDYTAWRVLLGKADELLIKRRVMMWTDKPMCVSACLCIQHSSKDSGPPALPSPIYHHPLNFSLSLLFYLPLNSCNN